MIKHFPGFLFGVLIIFLLSCTDPVQVPAPVAPAIRSIDDIAVVAPGEVTIFVDNATPTIPILSYHWSFDGGRTFSDSTSQNRLYRRFGIGDTGEYLWVVRARSDKQLFSEPDTFKVTITPATVVLGGDSVVYVGQQATYTAQVLVRHSGSAQTFIWSYAGVPGKSDTTSLGVIQKRWTVADTLISGLHLKVILDNGEELQASALPLRVLYSPPVVMLRADTSIICSDTLKVTSSVQSARPLSASPYHWVINDEPVARTSTQQIRLAWPRLHLGRNVVRLRVLNDDGLFSEEDSTIIDVKQFGPGTSSLSLLGERSVHVGQTSSFTVSIIESCAKANIKSYIWSFTGGPSQQSDTTVGGVLRKQWRIEDTSISAVRIDILLQDGGVQTSEFPLSVLYFPPSIALPRDTLISSTDSLSISAIAAGANSHIVKYYWSIDNSGWTDSTLSPTYIVPYGGKRITRVVSGVVDGNGLLATDTMHITFNRAPVIRSVTPASGDTLVYTNVDKSPTARDIRFSFSASDPDQDPITYRLHMGKSEPLSKIYSGSATSCSAHDIDTGDYSWRLVAMDSFGDSVVMTGTFVRMVRKTICFVGHSIVAGMGGDNTTGGFRKIVLDSLRANAPPKTLIRPIGPIQTPFLPDKNDDSCFAVSGTIARQMYSVFHHLPDLVADYWVAMFGVNDGYSSWNEQQGILSFLHAFHDRNPESKICVINGLRYSEENFLGYYYEYNLNYYNRMLSDTLTSLRHDGWDTHLIDAYTAFTADSVLDTTLMDPGDYHLHPNQKGYELLGRLVWEGLRE